jgi:hypothetical protein
MTTTTDTPIATAIGQQVAALSDEVRGLAQHERMGEAAWVKARLDRLARDAEALATMARQKAKGLA